MEREKIVSRNPNVMQGELVFAGTRVPPKPLVDYLNARRYFRRLPGGLPTVGREQAVAYLEMTLKAADLARAAR